MAEAPKFGPNGAVMNSPEMSEDLRDAYENPGKYYRHRNGKKPDPLTFVYGVGFGLTGSEVFRRFSESGWTGPEMLMFGAPIVLGLGWAIVSLMGRRRTN